MPVVMRSHGSRRKGDKMKIKKSEYRKALEDKYWKGVEAGMKMGIRGN